MVCETMGRMGRMGRMGKRVWPIEVNVLAARFACMVCGLPLETDCPGGDAFRYRRVCCGGCGSVYELVSDTVILLSSPPTAGK